MECTLLSLEAPSNIEKMVRELKTFLYREGGLTSARALPVMIPLCFLSPALAGQNRSELRDALRQALGRQAPVLRSGPIMENGGYLFWDLQPADELQRLGRRSAEVLSPGGQLPGEAASGAPPDGAPFQPFPPARGFILCSLEGRSLSDLPPLEAPERLPFPAKAAVILRLRSLKRSLEAAPRPAQREPGASEPNASVAGPWWRSLFWEELERIPLRKSPKKD